jgi:hypothetical protein
MEVYFDLASHFIRRSRGMCGTFDGREDSELTSVDGTVLSSAQVYSDSDNEAWNTKPTFGTPLLAYSHMHHQNSKAQLHSLI